MGTKFKFYSKIKTTKPSNNYKSYERTINTMNGLQIQRTSNYDDEMKVKNAKLFPKP
uniref:hypothetical protein n=1 Tax=Gelidibacter sp. TaxID=2018083 RepID=UPI0040495933